MAGPALRPESREGVARGQRSVRAGALSPAVRLGFGAWAVWASSGSIRGLQGAPSGPDLETYSSSSSSFLFGRRKRRRGGKKDKKARRAGKGAKKGGGKGDKKGSHKGGKKDGKKDGKRDKKERKRRKHDR